MVVYGESPRDILENYLDEGYFENDNVVISVDCNNTFIFRMKDAEHPFKTVCINECPTEELNDLLFDLIVYGWSC